MLRRPKATLTRSNDAGRERQRLGVAEQRRHDDAFVEQAIAALAEHRLVDVAVDDEAARADRAGEGARQVAGAAGDVEDAVAGTHARDADRVGLPEAMQAERHQVVHDVVLRRDRVEDAAHPLGLGLLVDGAEAEVGVAHRAQWRVTAGRRRRRAAHRRVAIDALLGEALFVLLPQLVLLRAEEVEVVPREDAGLVAVGEARQDGVVADRLERADLDLALSRLQDLLARPVALHFRRGRVDAHQLERDPERAAVVEAHLEHPALLMNDDAMSAGGGWLLEFTDWRDGRAASLAKRLPLPLRGFQGIAGRGMRTWAAAQQRTLDQAIDEQPQAAAKATWTPMATTTLAGVAAATPSPPGPD